MNQALREDDLDKMKCFGAFIKELRGVFLTDHKDQILSPFRGTVWRGITVPDLEKALQDYQPKKDFVWTAFTSTSTNKQVSLGFGNIVFEIRCDPPQGTYNDENFEFAPANIQPFSVFPNEEEILFPPNVKFRVCEVQMPSAQNKLQSPLVICDTKAFDGDDEVLHEFLPVPEPVEESPAAEAIQAQPLPPSPPSILKAASAPQVPPLASSPSSPQLNSSNATMKPSGFGGTSKLSTPTASQTLQSSKSLKDLATEQRREQFMKRYAVDLQTRRRRVMLQTRYQKQPFADQTGREKDARQGWGNRQFEPEARGLRLLYYPLTAKAVGDAS